MLKLNFQESHISTYLPIDYDLWRKWVLNIFILNLFILVVIPLLLHYPVRWKPQRKIKLISLRRGRSEKKHFEINDFLNFIVAHSFSINCRGSLHVTGFRGGHLLYATYDKTRRLYCWYEISLVVSPGSTISAIAFTYLPSSLFDLYSYHCNFLCKF